MTMARRDTRILRTIRLVMTGFAMGVADLIPGVSGGTIAFISGIYEELIRSIKTVTGTVPGKLLRGRPREALRLTPLAFLVPVGCGILAAVFTLSRLLAWLLKHHPVYLWAFFFGLVLSSIIVVGRRIRTWRPGIAVAALAAAGTAYVTVGMVPMQTPASLPWIFGGGAIAIIAMILPGISGSFILVILGKYEQILEAVNNRDVSALGVFAIGCAAGLALFSRLLSWMFDRYHDLSVAVLAGFMAGSLRKIWPWKEAVVTGVDRHGDSVALVERNLIPSVDIELAGAAALCLAAVGLIALLQRLRYMNERENDIAEAG